jgi:tripartite-type tricarboxylate transporter receptor subunit TctC
VAEGGLPGYEATAWQGLVAPAGVPREIITRLNREVDGILKLGDVRERIEADGAEPVGGTPEAFAAHIRKEHAKWSKVVKVSGAKVD